MRSDMKTLRVILAVGLVLAAAAFVPAQTGDGDKRFQEAKQLVFDEKWAEAQARLEDFLARYPQSPLAPQAVYYRSKCLGEQEGRATRLREDRLGVGEPRARVDGVP